MQITSDIHTAITVSTRLNEINTRANNARRELVELMSKLTLHLVDANEINTLRNAEQILLRIDSDTSFQSICEYIKTVE